MASFNDPKLSNHIADDVPAIRQLLRSVATLDPATGNTDIPNGAKRLVETAQGYEFQSYNGTGWVALEKWNLDVQKVDGYSASTGTTAGTIPVRDSSGKIPGDISGNAATASKAAALSATNPIATGGTGATTAEQARENLGTPPKSHASGSTEFGAGSSTQYGHLKSHDSPDATLTAATGHAFSPAGAAAMQETLEGQISDLASVVSGNEAAQSAKDAAQDEAISTAQSSADAAQSAVANAGFPSGTRMLFNQASAPTGWTKQVDVNDAALRVVSGDGGGTGGSLAFSALFATGKTVSLSGNVGATTLTVEQMPTHRHKVVHTQSYYTEYHGSNCMNTSEFQSKGTNSSQYKDKAVNSILDTTGSSSAHTHTLAGTATIELNVKYTDVIICAKD